jgi:ATPase family associated with various cellular activities (AAA)
MTYFIQKGKSFFTTPDLGVEIFNTLPVGNYIIQVDPMQGFYLEQVDSFEQLPKLYGSVTKNTDRIFNTFESRPNSTGVVLAGEKGSGKTLLAKQLSIRAAQEKYPTLIINAPHHGDGFNKFIQDLQQPAVILFDEFEKVYEADQQEMVLTLLDGVFPSKKLFVITCNDEYRINTHMKNRPGRIFYLLHFRGLEPEFIREYCLDTLKNQKHIQTVGQIASLFQAFNFDMLKALIEEMNRYDESPQEAIRMLNAKPEYSEYVNYDVVFVNNGELVSQSNFFPTTWKGNPLKDSWTITDYTERRTRSQSKKKAPATYKLKKISTSQTMDENFINAVLESNIDKEQGSGDASIRLEASMLINVNSNKGTYTYSARNGKTTVILKKIQPKDYDWSALI